MSDRFLIRQAELLAVEGNVRQLCAGLSNSTDACIRSIDLFVGNAAFSGAFATSAKAYMAQVHKVILQGIVQAAQSIEEQFREYLNQYASVDEQAGFILASDQMEEYTRALDHSFSELSSCAGQIRGILQTVSSFVSAAAAPWFPWEQAGDATQGICARVQGLKENVLSLEAAYQSRLSSLRALTENLEQTIRTIGSGECGGLGIGIYASGTFVSIAGASAAFLTDRVMTAELQRLGISEEQVHLLQGYDYQPEDLMTLYESCETEEDRMLWKRLFSGDYENAFAIDPIHLSEPMSLVLSDYARRLLGAGDTDQFQSFVNGILFQTAGTGWFSEPGPGVRTTRMSYLENLFQGTMVLLELNSAMLLQGNVTPEMKEKNWQLLSLANLWSSQYHLEDELQYQRDPRFPPVVTFFNGGLEGYDMAYTYMYTKASHNPFQDRGDVVSIDVTSDILETSEDLLNGTYLAERGHLQESADQLLQQVLGESLWSAGCSVLYMAVPEVGVACKMLETAVRQDADNIDDHLLNIAGKVSPGVNGTEGLVLGEAIDGLQMYLDKNAELSDRISQLDHLYEGSMWGTGIRSSYVVPDIFSSGQKIHILSGIYNPDYLETIGNWNREGITALLPDADLEQIGQVLSAHPEYSSIEPGTLEYKMIYGFDQDFKYKSILDYPISDIAAAKTTVESIIREACQTNPAAAYWNIEEAF